MKRRLHDFPGESARSTQKKRVAEILESRTVEFLIVFFVMVDAVLVLIEAGVQDHLLCVGGRVVTCPPAAAPAEGAALAQAWHLQGGLAPDTGRRTGLRAATLAAEDWQLNQPHSSEHSLPHSSEHSSDNSGSPLPHSAEHSSYNSGSPLPHSAEHSSDHSGSLCPHPGEPVLVCDTKDGHEARHLTHVCHVLSVSILCAFVIELSLKWWVNPTEFASNFYHKLDFFVTIVSLLMDTVVYAAIESYKGHDVRGEQAELSLFVLSALLILARTWRLVRIFHGIFEEFHLVVDEEVARREEARMSGGAGPDDDSCGGGGPTAVRPAD